MTFPKPQVTALTILGTVLTVLAILALLIEICGFNPDFYAVQYAQNETASYVGVSSEDLNEATEVLLDYLKDERDDLDFEVERDGSVRPYYNEREIAHMADVKNLNLSAQTFSWLGLITGVALIVLALFFSGASWRVWKTFFFSILGVLAAFAVLAACAAADFTSFWISFHHVFFRNDLWTFDPATSLLIRMFEEKFFFDLVTQILIWFLSICGALLVLSFYLWKRGRKGAFHAYSGN